MTGKQEEEGHSFGWALEQLNEGKMVRRGKRLHVRIAKVVSDGYTRLEAGGYVWCPGSSDLFATDWQLAE